MKVGLVNIADGGDAVGSIIVVMVGGDVVGSVIVVMVKLGVCYRSVFKSVR